MVQVEVTIMAKSKAQETGRPLTDGEMRERSGRTWDEWFAIMDEFGGPSKGRRELGGLLVETHKLKDPWLSSTLLVEYEAARGAVEKDGRAKGYMICSTKTVAATPAAAYEAWTTGDAWSGWFAPGVELEFAEGGRFAAGDGARGEIKKIRPAKAIRLAWEHPDCAPGTPVEVTFQPKGADKCIVMVAHDRIQTRREADDLRDSWGRRLDALKTVLEA
jgi:uncharacterized protein YndB with AHSA1/START domain